jgi:triphosphoribosyl-dephospho-CoA synthase
MPLAMQTVLAPREIADLAVSALHNEVDLTPKPGLVDRRGPGAHTDMTRAVLHDSAESLHTALCECAVAANELPTGPALRARIGVIGRAGERAMLATTAGVNTHRGALWALGLLSTAVGADATTAADAVAIAAQLARLPDPAHEPQTVVSHGAHARRRYGVTGALGEAQAGFPHVMRYALPALRSGQALDALVVLMAHLDDTCLLHRGGTGGLSAVQRAAQAVVAAGGISTVEGRQRFWILDRICATRRLSPGGAGDLLAVTLFLDSLDIRRAASCKL